MRIQKVLTVAIQHAKLNRFQLFALSDRTVSMGSSCGNPTTALWGALRYMYSPMSHDSIYYDIKLKDPLGAERQSAILPTTAIVTNDRIYVPVPMVPSRRFRSLTVQKSLRSIRHDYVEKIGVRSISVHATNKRAKLYQFTLSVCSELSAGWISSP
jgi:hypothetical protein